MFTEAAREALKLQEAKSNYVTQEEYEKGAQIDQTVLISDLSHQLEEARGRIEMLEKANEEWRIENIRAKAARDAVKELFTELWDRRPVS